MDFLCKQKSNIFKISFILNKNLLHSRTGTILDPDYSVVETMYTIALLEMSAFIDRKGAEAVPLCLHHPAIQSRFPGTSVFMAWAPWKPVSTLCKTWHVFRIDFRRSVPCAFQEEHAWVLLVCHHCVSSRNSGSGVWLYQHNVTIAMRQFSLTAPHYG